MNNPAREKSGELGKIELKKTARPVTRGRDAKLQSVGRQAISTLYMLVRNVKMYDPDNEIFNQPFENLRQAINTIVAIDGVFELHAVGTTVYINKKQIKLDFQSLDNVRFLTDQFKENDVGGFNVSRPVQVKELKSFLGLFTTTQEEERAAETGFANITVGKFARISEQLDRMEEGAIDA